MKTSLLTILLILPGCVWSALDPYYKDAIERGYKIKGDSVLFTDGSACLYQEFLNGNCGQKWKTSDYCVPQGKPVWDTNRCCQGLRAFILPQSDGQRTCEKLPGRELKSKLRWLYWFFPAVLLVFILFAVRNFINSRKTNRQ